MKPMVRISHTEQETFALGMNLAGDFNGDEVVLLRGDLGAGKTVFTKGLAAGLGVADPSLVCSPSFTLINIYQGKFKIAHMDLYRLEKGADLHDLGWEDYLGNAVIVVEWSEKMDYTEPAVFVEIEVLENEDRRIKIRDEREPAKKRPD